VDDATFYLATGVLILACVVIFADALIRDFETPDGLWTMLTAFAAFLGARAVGRSLDRRNGQNGGKR
jgi:O-antigen ligase